jgi:DNA-binding beta-propeller fold protein YncE
VLTPNQQRLWRIDPRTNVVNASIPVANASALVASPTNVWVIAEAQGVLSHIDPRTNTIDRTEHLMQPVGGAVMGRDRLWVATQ